MATEQATTTETPVLSEVEGIKTASRWLRGSLATEMASGADHFSDEAKQLLKFHGSYQQEDRDARKNRAKAGVGKHYMFMIRLRLPGGVMTADQYLAMDEICEKHANGTLRLTTRQSIQFHGIVMGHLKSSIQDINAALLSSLGACGDVNRNVMACPAPINDQPHQEAQKLAYDIAMHLAPKSKAYHDIWLNGVKQSPDAEMEDGVEPIYGKVYLPRKFKACVSMPNDNCVDIYANDLGFLAAIENGKTVGYNVTIGGGFGRSNGKPETFAHLGQALCFVKPEEVVEAAEAVIKFYRDHGDRTNRKRARLKYVVHDMGMDKVREIFQAKYWSKPLVMPRDLPITAVDLHHGWHSQGNGKWFLGLSIENGRIKDEGSYRLRSGIREIVKRFKTGARVTGQQDLLLCDISTADRPAVESLLNEYGIPKPESLSLLQRWSMACPAIPTCGLAITESERALPGLIDQLEGVVNDVGLADEAISIRMTGCPNGCARPYNSDIGLVGRAGEKYTMYVGGTTRGDQLNFLLQDQVHRDKVVDFAKVLFTSYKAERKPGQLFGDWCQARGVESLCGLLGLPLPKPV